MRSFSFSLSCSSFIVPSAPWSSERRSVSFLTVFRMELKRPGVFFISAMDEEDPGSLEFHPEQDRKSTRLNSSHVRISYAVFCLKKKKNIQSRPLPMTSTTP